MPNTRPTTDRAREALFNILANRLDFDGLRALDLFAGTGSLSYELCSRGAVRVVAVEKDPAMHAFIQKTAVSLSLSATLHAVRMDVFQYLESGTESYQLILADPPYALSGIERLPEKVFNRGLLQPGGYLVVEHNGVTSFPERMERVLLRNYGDTSFSFFQMPEAGS